MSERITPKVERTAEQHIGASEAKEHQSRVKHERESRAEQAGKNRNETDVTSREIEAREQAVASTEYDKPQSEKVQPATYLKDDKQHAFNTVMHHARQSMSKPEKTFSKFIHRPAVEKTSDVLGKTVLRPSGVTGAGIAAFIGLLSVYSIAKFAGFELSGSEMPLLLSVGFVAGLLTEWLFKAIRVVVSPKNS